MKSERLWNVLRFAEGGWGSPFRTPPSVYDSDLVFPTHPFAGESMRMNDLECSRPQCIHGELLCVAVDTMTLTLIHSDSEGEAPIISIE